MEYKSSVFNLFIEYKEDYLLFNSFTSALLLIQNNQIEKIKNLLTHPNSCLDKCKLFIDNGFLVKADLDEIKMIFEEYIMTKNNSNFLSLQIVVNTDCNFTCKYCFEKKTKQYLKDKNLLKVKNFLETSITPTKSVSVVWMGGEPLLSWDSIKVLSKILLKNDSYESFMFTNAYLFSPQIIDDLLDFKINGIQITLDGHAEMHNKRRNLQNKTDSYSQIIGNIEKIISKYGKKIKITINSNLDYENYLSYPKLLEDLTPLNKFINIGIARTIYDKKHINKELPFELFYTYKREMHLLAKNLGFLNNINIIPKKLDYPACFHEMKNGFTIAPDANVYKCIHQLNKKKYGFINDSGKLIKYKNLESKFWDNYSVVDRKECNNCEILPLCMGACAKQNNDNSHCELAKSLIKNRLITFFEFS
jgi:uncharacterized protein